MNDHRLSRVLGYDGMRAAKRAGVAPQVQPGQKAPVAGGLLGYDGEKTPDSEGIVSKAIKRARKFVGLDDDKPKPTPTPKRPPPGQKKVLDRKLDVDTGELSDKPHAAVKLGDDAIAVRPRGGAPRGPVTRAGAGPTARTAPPAVAPPFQAPGRGEPGQPAGPIARPKPAAAPPQPRGGAAARPEARGAVGKPQAPGAGGLGVAAPFQAPGGNKPWSELGTDGYSLNSQITKEGSAFDGKELGCDGGKVEKTLHEFKVGELHSGSKAGPKVTKRKQAIAIALNQARKAGEKV